MQVNWVKYIVFVINNGLNNCSVIKYFIERQHQMRYRQYIWGKAYPTSIILIIR